MLFNSNIFLFAFLPLVLALWYARSVPTRAKLIGLTVASYIFYGYWDWRFTGLMAASTLIDYVAGARIHRAVEQRDRRLWLLVSLATNLGLLGFFKYAGFFAASVNSLHAWLSSGDLLPPIELILPVGISFYTFQSMSYSIDIYRRTVAPTVSFWHFAAYVSMFPQLVAGPIVRYSEMEQQLREFAAPPAPPMIAHGVHFFVVGLAKKLLIADPVAGQVDLYFQGGAPIDLVTAWLATLGYSVQIYFDFSGYSDMAVGLGLLLGFRLPQNFNSPYKSGDISEFWRRWHMTLSFWLRDYVFIALGGSRTGRLRTLRNLLITMFLGGLWHGAAWTFVFWGLLHGMYLVVHDQWRNTGISLPRPLACGLTFLAVIVAWVFFRAPDFATAFEILGAMFGGDGLRVPTLPELRELGIISLGLAIAFVAPNSWEWKFRPGARMAVATAVLFIVCVLRLSKESPFIYFQF